MSAPKHEQAADDEAQQAQEHQAQFDPDAWSAGSGGCDTFCFDTWSNPTSEHAQEARKHRALAAKHRRASEALRKAEDRACAGIPERDRDVSPFFHVADIASVHAESERFEVRFKSVPGLDASGLQQLIDCHLARNAVRGFDAPEMDYCPLVPKGVRAEVEADGSTLVIELEADDVASRDDVRSRLRRLDGRLQADQ